MVQAAEGTRTTYEAALSVTESLEVILIGLHDLQGDPSALPEMPWGEGTSLTQLLLHCNWLADESRGRLAAVRQDIDRLH